METFSLDKVKATIILDTRRPKQSGYFPIKYRVTFNRKQVYYPCMDMTIEDWESLKNARKKELVKSKEIIQAGFKRITDTIEDMVKNEGFTIEGLNTRMSRGIKDSILSAFDNRIENLKRGGRIGTSVWYSCAMTSIIQYAKKDLKFADITVNWLKNYEAYLLKGGKTFTTISMYMRALRAIVNEGKANGIINQAQYPFLIKDNGKYAIPEESGRKIALTEDQLMNVFNYPILPDDEKWRDLWIFSFYCAGANINDILRFKYENIVGNGIEWFRKKTISQDKKKKKIRAIITEEMKIIMDKYGNPDKRPSNYLFQYLSHGLTPTDERRIIQNVTHTINKKMHSIGRALGYGDITTYWSRHSWASISRRKGVSTFAISKGLGHKNLATTEIYLDSLSDDELIENAAKLPRRKNAALLTKF